MAATGRVPIEDTWRAFGLADKAVVAIARGLVLEWRLDQSAAVPLDDTDFGGEVTRHYLAPPDPTLDVRLVLRHHPLTDAELMALAVLRGDTVAALGLADKVTEAATGEDRTGVTRRAVEKAVTIDRIEQCASRIDRQMRELESRAVLGAP